MGAFLLVSRNAGKFNSPKALEAIKLQCRTEPVCFRLAGWNLYLFPKYHSNTKNFRESEDCSIFVTGTPFIFGSNYSDTLDKLKDQLINGKFDEDTIHGQFFLLVNDGNRLKFFTDHYGIYSVYHSTDRNVISSSFLAICNGLISLTPDRDSIVENLLTGSLIGSETVFGEVKRFEPGIPVSFNDLEFKPAEKSRRKVISYRNRKESQSGQIEALDIYFSGLKTFAEEVGVDSGITGGMDSRLLLALCRRHFDKNKIQFHTHLRKTIDNDYFYGNEICQKAGLQFIKTPVSDVVDLTGMEIIEAMDNGMLFNDGQVRTHSFWHEEFNTASYRIKILKDKGLGLNGIGGEAYRNKERFLLPSWNFRDWIDFELTRKYAGNRPANKKTRINLSENIYNKIVQRLGTGDSSRINLLGIKRYMNEIYNPANRGLRGGYENRLSFFLSPFADPLIAETAYNAVDHLGISINYEAELINMIDPEIAAVNSVYVFSFNKGEPFTSYIHDVFFRNFLPVGIQSVLFEKYSVKNTAKWEILQKTKEHMGMCVEILNSYNLPVDITELMLRTDMGPLVFAMGHLLNRFREKIN